MVFNSSTVRYKQSFSMSGGLCVMPFPQVAVKQKAKREPGGEEGIVLPFVKRSRVCFLCAVGLSRLPQGEREAFGYFLLNK